MRGWGLTSSSSSPALLSLQTLCVDPVSRATGSSHQLPWVPSCRAEGAWPVTLFLRPRPHPPQARRPGLLSPGYPGSTGQLVGTFRDGASQLHPADHPPASPPPQ